MHLKQYQRKAVDQLIQHTKTLLTNPEKKKRLVLKSPTASGKTVILSAYMKEVGKKTKEDVCFLWLSIGNGKLHEQSQKKIVSYLDGFPPCRLLEDVIQDGIINQEEIVVVNWEKLNTKKKGNWDNVLMREGEKTNFQELVKATNKKRKIILLVDESHHTMDSETSQELIELIQPEIMVEASATPKTIPSLADANANRGQFVEVDYKNVVKEGMVKEEVWINDNIDDVSGEGSLQLVMNMGLQRRNELKNIYRSLGRNVNPLLLIQIPNARDGEKVLESVIPHLKEQGISVEEGNLAIWTSQQTENLTGIKNNQSPVDVLIFKVAVATGWDCPRSQVLVKLRETKSETFDIQTIGRILRMPEQCHYENEWLNRAYIYTNNPDIVVKIEDLSIIKTNHSTLKPQLKTVSLTSEYIESKENPLAKNDWFFEVLETVLKEQFGFKESEFDFNKTIIAKYGYHENKDELVTTLISNGKLRFEELNQAESQALGEQKTFELTNKEVEIQFNRFLEQISPRFHANIRPLIYYFCHNYLGFERYQTAEMEALTLLNKEKVFIPIFGNIDKLYRELYHEREKRENMKQLVIFNLPKFKMFDEEQYEEVSTSYYAYEPCYLEKNRSTPEREFEQFIKSQGDKIEWWVKNEDSGKDAFSIHYQCDGKDHLFYPDYIVLFKTGLVGLYETKAENDQDATTKTKAKAEALQRYLKENQDVTGGIVIPKNGVLYINEDEVYDHKQTNKPLMRSNGFC